MKIVLKTTLKTLALGFMLTASLQSAQANSDHTYVSGTVAASDSNPCTRLSPCATFQGALTKTSAGGMISALDAGDYGTMIIHHSVTIDGAGTQASIVTSSGLDAISIQGASTDTIILRHLIIQGLPSNSFTKGITLLTGNLEVDDCKISGFYSDTGLDLHGSGSVIAENTTISGCYDGIIETNAGPLSLRNVTLQRNRNQGLYVQGGPTDISHSLITQNGGYGLAANSTTLSVLNCIIAGNSTAVYADNNSVIRLTNNDIFNNTTGIATNGNTPGIVSTAQNNHKAGSTTPGAPTPGKIIVTQ